MRASPKGGKNAHMKSAECANIDSMAHFVDQIALDITITHGEGSYLFDDTGKKYLDLIAGWCVGSIGWGHSEIRTALEAEAKRATYIPPFFRDKAREELATTLTDIAPGNLKKVFPCVSGSEAVDMALKIVRAATGKTTILSIADVYQGHTYGASSIGDAHKRITGPVVPNCEYLPMPVRDASSDEVLALLKKRLARKDVAAFVSEPVWTNAGMYIPPLDFYPEVQKLCHDAGALLVMDEVATGFGHTGKLFGSELWNLEPDVLCIGKAFTGGYASMAATLTTEDVWEKSRGIPCYSTFAWLPTDLAATAANVKIILRDRLWGNAKSVGDHLLSLLEPMRTFPNVKDIRGIGLIFAIELKSSVKATDIQKELCKAGVLVETTGNALFFTPQLTLSKKEAEEGAKILTTIL